MTTDGLTPGEIELLVNGLYDDVAFVWVLIRLGIRSNPPMDAGPPSATDVASAFEILEGLEARGLIAVGRVEYVDGGAPGRVAPVRHVAEPLPVVRARVDAACSDADWEWSCWVVNTEKGNAAAQAMESGTSVVPASTPDRPGEPVALDIVEEALRELEGLTFWDGGRAADMKMFAFGSPREVPRRGGDVTVGQFALHLQCPWRLRQNGVTLTTHEDISTSTGSGGSASADRATNRCAEVIERLFASDAFAVVSASCQPLSDLTIACTNGLVLEVRVDDDNAEQWRLFAPAEVPGQGQDHLVVERIDGDLVAAWE